jgi:glycosyltransferase involved in cell wall biosynthesis
MALDSVREIDYVAPPDKNTVVYVRGGFKPWLPWIKQVQANGNWCVFYAANTGRNCWPFWDIVFDDLSDKTRLVKGRLFMAYRKPVNPCFRVLPGVKHVYDVCLGASHIFDRKGQFRSYRAVLAYERKYGKKLQCILPGGFYQREKGTEAMRAELEAHPNIVVPGTIERDELAEVYNASRIFMHTGYCGQGDRSVMEAGHSGCYLMVAHPPRHSPYVTSDWVTTTVLDDGHDPAKTADQLHGVLADSIQWWQRRLYISDYFRREGGVKEQSLPMFKRLFTFFKKHPFANREALKELL